MYQLACEERWITLIVVDITEETKPLYSAFTANVTFQFLVIDSSVLNSGDSSMAL